jgi:hypothetical protein
MAAPEVPARLEDILEAIAAIDAYTLGKSLRGAAVPMARALWLRQQLVVRGLTSVAWLISE